MEIMIRCMRFKLSLRQKHRNYFILWFSLVSCFNLFDSFHWKGKYLIFFSAIRAAVLNVLIRKMVLVRSRCVCHSDSTQNPTHLLRLRSLTFGVYFNSATIYSLNSFHFVRWLYLPCLLVDGSRCCRIAIWSKKNVCLRVKETTSHASYTSKFDNLSSELLLQPHDI